MIAVYIKRRGAGWRLFFLFGGQKIARAAVSSTRGQIVKKPRRVRARRREKSSDHVRRRRVRRRKYFTSCKLREPPRAQAMRSAIGQGEPMQSKVQSWNLCAVSAKIMRAAWRKPSQTRTQRSGPQHARCFVFYLVSAAVSCAIMSSSLVGMTQTLTLESGVEMTTSSPRSLFFSASSFTPR